MYNFHKTGDIRSSLRIGRSAQRDFADADELIRWLLDYPEIYAGVNDLRKLININENRFSQTHRWSFSGSPHNSNCISERISHFIVSEISISGNKLWGRDALIIVDKLENLICQSLNDFIANSKILL